MAPLVLLAGGPGQSALEQGPAIAPTLRAIHGGDLILLEQRGTGASNRLNCEGGFEILRPGAGEAIDACVAALGGRADLRRYGTPEAVEDLEAARRALGYETLDLFGVSYGTRVATAYMRRYPSRVRSALLRAAAPPDFNIVLEGSANADAELARVLAECASDRVCGAGFPELEQKLASIRTQLERQPARVAATSASGQAEEIVVSPQLFNSTIYVMLLSAPTRQRLPGIIAEIAAGGFQPLAPVLSQVRNAVYSGVPVGMYLSVICSEDIPRIPPAEAARRPTGMAGQTPVLVEVCSRWPTRKAPSSLFAPLRVKVPTLILSGAVDPATTVTAANRLAATLPNAEHIILPATAHSPPVPACAQPAVARFFAAAAVPGGRGVCQELRLPSFAPPAGR